MHYTKLYKICLLSHCLFCFKSLMHIYKKCDFLTKIFKNFFRFLQFLSNFYHCFKAAAKTNTIFHYGKNCARRFVNHKHFSNFLGTVPTFGFRISIVENVRSQKFLKNWLSEVQKFYRIRLLFEYATYYHFCGCISIFINIYRILLYLYMLYWKFDNHWMYDIQWLKVWL